MPRTFLRVRRQRAESLGIPVASVAQTVQAALSGPMPPTCTTSNQRSRCRFACNCPESQIGLDAVLALPLRAANGKLVPCLNWSPSRRHHRQTVVHQRPAACQLCVWRHGWQARLAAVRSVRHPQTARQRQLAWHRQAGGILDQTAQRPYRAYAIKWDGEWQITYETFRDMGAAYGVGLILIYLLVVAQFKSYRTPLIIMAPYH